MPSTLSWFRSEFTLLNNSVEFQNLLRPIHVGFLLFNSPERIPGISSRQSKPSHDTLLRWEWARPVVTLTTLHSRTRVCHQSSLLNRPQEFVGSNSHRKTSPVLTLTTNKQRVYKLFIVNVSYVLFSVSGVSMREQGQRRLQTRKEWPRTDSVHINCKRVCTIV